MHVARCTSDDLIVSSGEQTHKSGYQHFRHLSKPRANYKAATSLPTMYLILVVTMETWQERHDSFFLLMTGSLNLRDISPLTYWAIPKCHYSPPGCCVLPFQLEELWGKLWISLYILTPVLWCSEFITFWILPVWCYSLWLWTWAQSGPIMTLPGLYRKKKNHTNWGFV